METNPENLHKPFLRLFTANELAILTYVRRLVPTRHDAARWCYGGNLPD